MHTDEVKKRTCMKWACEHAGIYDLTMSFEYWARVITYWSSKIWSNATA